MSATIYIEQESGTWSGHVHRHNGYSSGFSPSLVQFFEPTPGRDPHGKSSTEVASGL